MQVTGKVNGDTLYIFLSGELDEYNASAARSEADALIDRSLCCARAVFDLADVHFMDSSGIGILLNRYKQMERSGGSVVLYGAGPQIQRILSIGGISRLMPCYATKEAALAG